MLAKSVPDGGPTGGEIAVSSAGEWL